MFDNVCKFLAETYSVDFATWLLGQPTTFTQLSPTELSIEPIRADALILLQSEELVLHLEFQTDPDADIPFRMADYRLRVHRRFPNKQMRQVVLYLRQTRSELVYQNSFSLENTQHQFEVIRLWEQPTEIFLQASGLLPFAVLSQTQNREQVLQAVAQQVEAVNDSRQRSNLAAISGILAGLILSNETIRRFLRQDIMRESVFYQDIFQQGELRGEQREARSLVLRQLTHRVGELPPSLQSQVEALPLAQLENLSLALLNFQNETDLQHWLERG
jgi:predicted transposase/invertase (TIGR01784 family)